MGTHKLDRYTELGVQKTDMMTFIYIDKISIQNALNGKFGSSDHSSLTFVWEKKWNCDFEKHRNGSEGQQIQMKSCYIANGISTWINPCY